MFTVIFNKEEVRHTLSIESQTTAFIVAEALMWSLEGRVEVWQGMNLVKEFTFPSREEWDE